MNSTLLFVYSSIGVLVATLVVLGLRRTNLALFNPVVIMVSLAAVDAFVPGIVWSLFGVPEAPVWKDAIGGNELASGLAFYMVFYLLMLAPLTYYVASVRINYDNIAVYKRRLFWLLIATLLLSCAKLWLEISSEGGIIEWFWAKAKLRWVGASADDHGPDLLELILDKPPWRILFNALVLCAFYFRHQHNRRYLYGLVLPMLAIILSLTTFFRGSVLMLLIGLAFVEFIRYRDVTRKITTQMIQYGSRLKHRTRRSSRRLILASIVFFLVVGTLRGYFESVAWDAAERQHSQLLRIVSQGSGLDGVGQVVRFYSESGSYLGGKTYRDMLLLPVPRAIYTNKPEWYGIDDITRGMGWPESTQSAVTIPGEAFANFSWFGLLVAPVFGMLFFLLTKACFDPNRGALVFLYPGVGFYVFFISNWMAFTGVMNQLFGFLAVYMTLRWISRRPTKGSLVT